MKTMDNIRLLFIKENSQWICQCLEYDINSQGNTFDESLELFKETFKLCDLKDKHPAPDMYHVLYENSEVIQKSLDFIVDKDKIFYYTIRVK